MQFKRAISIYLLYVICCRFSSDEDESFNVQAVLQEQANLMRKERSSANVR